MTMEEHILALALARYYVAHGSKESATVVINCMRVELLYSNPLK